MRPRGETTGRFSVAPLGLESTSLAEPHGSTAGQALSPLRGWGSAPGSRNRSPQRGDGAAADPTVGKPRASFGRRSAATVALCGIRSPSGATESSPGFHGHPRKIPGEIPLSPGRNRHRLTALFGGTAMHGCCAVPTARRAVVGGIAIRLEPDYVPIGGGFSPRTRTTGTSSPCLIRFRGCASPI
jgi:hypothetical protein